MLEYKNNLLLSRLNEIYLQYAGSKFVSRNKSFYIYPVIKFKQLWKN